MTVRTSVTHPLAIATVAAGIGMGRIGITFAPGKHQLNAATGAWARDLEADIEAIAHWGAVAVVSLIEPREIAALRITGLGAAVAARHMAWYHLPIPDVSEPTAAFERAWDPQGAALRAILRDGFDILIHCKGGLGRAGTVAARLMAELGAEPDAAIAAVRAARPGAIETRGQEAHVRRVVPIPEPVPARSPEAVADRARGCLLGLAVGDAIGTTVEFRPRESFPPIVGITGGGPFKLEPGQWTDDTAMALALAASITAKDGIDEHDLMERFVRWWKQGDYSCTVGCFDIGITTRQALGRYLATGDPIAGDTDPHTAGNGSLMRLAPVALWGLGRSESAVRDAARRQDATTHGAPQAVAACEGYALMMRTAIEGMPRTAVLAGAMTHDDTIDPIMRGSWRGQPRRAIHSSGYVAHSLEAALWCVGRTRLLPQALLP